MKILIDKFLEENNKTAPIGSYIVQDDGNGAFIALWDETKIGIAKPTFTQAEIDSIPLMEKKKNIKIILKNIRVNSNSTNLFLQAHEILNPFDPLNSKSADLVNFEFSLEPTGDKLTDFRAVLNAFSLVCNLYTLGLKTIEEVFICYSCKISNADGTKRKGYIFLDGNVVSSIYNHLNARAGSNIVLINEIEKEIEAATTIEEVDTIFNSLQLSPNHSRIIT